MFLSNAGIHPQTHHGYRTQRTVVKMTVHVPRVAHYLWTQGLTCPSSLITSPRTKHMKRGRWLQACYSKMWPNASWPISNNYLKLLTVTSIARCQEHKRLYTGWIKLTVEVLQHCKVPLFLLPCETLHLPAVLLHFSLVSTEGTVNVDRQWYDISFNTNNNRIITVQYTKHNLCWQLWSYNIREQSWWYPETDIAMTLTTSPAASHIFSLIWHLYHGL